MKKILKDVNADKVHALYDAAPYPEVLEGKMRRGTPLLAHWINAAVAPDGPALHPQANILSAGCGSGAEVFLLARQFPQAKVTGLDFSEASILRARQQAAAEQITNVRFDVADLTSEGWQEKYDAFDFISCHGVADFVSDAAAFMQNLSSCLAPEGVICMTVNSPDHPGERIRNAFGSLGIDAADFEDTARQRKLLQMMVGLMGSSVGIEGLAEAPKGYLDVDVFPPIAHHDSIDTWCKRAEDCGLWFCGSMDAAVGLTEINDKQLPLLYQLDKARLSVWMAKLRRQPGMQLLFSRRQPTGPNFDKPEEILAWRPLLSSSVGQLPEMTVEPDQHRPMTLRFEALPDFIIYSTAYDLEVLRCCDGSRSVQEIREAIPAEGDWESLLACLFRAFHFGVLTGC
jgi:SAM-dependent methyltransferase